MRVRTDFFESLECLPRVSLVITLILRVFIGIIDLVVIRVYLVIILVIIRLI